MIFVSGQIRADQGRLPGQRRLNEPQIFPMTELNEIQIVFARPRDAAPFGRIDDRARARTEFRIGRDFFSVTNNLRKRNFFFS